MELCAMMLPQQSIARKKWAVLNNPFKNVHLAYWVINLFAETNH